MSDVDETIEGADLPLIPGGMAERLLVRDSHGVPTAINTEEFKKALWDQDTLTNQTAEKILELESVLNQATPAERRLLLRCAFEVAAATDRFVEAEVLRESSLSEALDMNPSVDPEVREFLDSLANWPSPDAQPPEVTRAIERSLESESFEPDALVLCRGRSIADFIEGELQFVLAHEGWGWPQWGFLPNEAYGYFMPVIFEKVLRPRGRLAADTEGVLRHFGPRLDPSSNGWLGVGGESGPFLLKAKPDGYTPLQRKTFFRFLQLVRRRPDIEAFNRAQLEAAVCYHFFWKDRANWAVEG
jgi:hypothetical protein